MINRRTFTAMLAGLPFLRLPVNAQPKTVDVCSNCGDYPKISRENPHAFSVHFGDNVSASAERFVIYAVPARRSRVAADIRERNDLGQSWASRLLTER